MMKLEKADEPNHVLRQRDHSLRDASLWTLGIILAVSLMLFVGMKVVPYCQVRAAVNRCYRVSSSPSSLQLEMERLGGAEATRRKVMWYLHLSDSMTSKRGFAAMLLRPVGTRALPDLLQLLRHYDSDVRAEVSEQLGAMHDSEAVTPLIGALNDGNTGVRQAVIYALGHIGDARAIDPLVEAFSRGNEAERHAVPEALGRIKDERAMAVLVNILKDRESDLRSQAAKALGWSGSQKAIEPLTAALQDSDSSVRSAALKALNQLSATPAPCDGPGNDSSAVPGTDVGAHRTVPASVGPEAVGK